MKKPADRHNRRARVTTQNQPSTPSPFSQPPDLDPVGSTRFGLMFGRLGYLIACADRGAL